MPGPARRSTVDLVIPRGGEGLGFGITDAHKRGLSIYRNDRRVVVTYKMFAKDGRVLKSGRMNYG